MLCRSVSQRKVQREVSEANCGTDEVLLAALSDMGHLQGVSTVYSFCFMVAVETVLLLIMPVGIAVPDTCTSRGF